MAMAGHVYCHYMYCNLAISVTPCIETNKLCVCVCVNVILFFIHSTDFSHWGLLACHSRVHRCN